MEIEWFDLADAVGPIRQHISGRCFCYSKMPKVSVDLVRGRIQNHGVGQQSSNLLEEDHCPAGIHVEVVERIGD